MKHRAWNLRPTIGPSRHSLFSKHFTTKSSCESTNPRWLPDLHTRIGRCIQFGLGNRQVQQAGKILGELNHNWREFIAGSQGFLTDKNHRGLYRQEVVWGEMHGKKPRSSPDIVFRLAKNLLKGHVNNVTYNRFAESARINWAQKYATRIDPAHRKEWSELWTPQGDGLILRSIRTDFKFPMKWPDRVSVYHKLRELPSESTDSFILDVIILSELHRRVAARCTEDIVVYDYRNAKKVPLRPFMVESFQDTFRLQEQAKHEYSAAMARLMDQVRELEKDSWDRADAKEDFGSSGQAA